MHCTPPLHARLRLTLLLRRPMLRRPPVLCPCRAHAVVMPCCWAPMPCPCYAHAVAMAPRTTQARARTLLQLPLLEGCELADIHALAHAARGASCPPRRAPPRARRAPRPAPAAPPRAPARTRPARMRPRRGGVAVTAAWRALCRATIIGGARRRGLCARGGRARVRAARAGGKRGRGRGRRGGGRSGRGAARRAGGASASAASRPWASSIGSTASSSADGAHRPRTRCLTRPASRPPR